MSVSRGHELVTEFLTSRDTVTADESQVNQVLMNLAVNAADAMPNGGRLLIQTSDAEPEAWGVGDNATVARGPYVRLTVADNGIGMDAATFDRIFEPFFTTKDTGKGTGLGLSMVYGVVRQCGGFIRVETAPGEGATFNIFLPLTTKGAIREDQRNAVIGVTGGSETILVVEDQDNVRELAVETLRSYGYSVISASTGDDALATAGRTQEPIDLLLTDIVMPGMNGTALAGLLLESRPQMKVVFMSGYPDDIVGPESAMLSGLQYLPKPFSPDELAARVREISSGNGPDRCRLDRLRSGPPPPRH